VIALIDYQAGNLTSVKKALAADKSLAAALTMHRPTHKPFACQLRSPAAPRT